MEVAKVLDVGNGRCSEVHYYDNEWIWKVMKFELKGKVSSKSKAKVTGGYGSHESVLHFG